jgi:hypothetical protein
MKDRIVWIDEDKVFVIRKGKTSNKKITDGKSLVQTYTFSIGQWKLANSGDQFTLKQFFALDGANCLDCPFSVGSGDGGCYTHKGMQYLGMLSMLRSIDKSELTPMITPVFEGDVLYDRRVSEIIDMCRDTYVRFGTYGEPSLLPWHLVRWMAEVSSSYTGYTHQWEKEWARPYADFFMASRHEADAVDGWRSFIAADVQTIKASGAVGCPASKEAGFKANCAACGLCSGLKGKGKKDVKIILH